MLKFSATSCISAFPQVYESESDWYFDGGELKVKKAFEKN